MAFAKTHDESVPAGSTKVAASQVTDVKTGFRERLAYAHYFYADESGHDDVGWHKTAGAILNYGDTGDKPTTEVGGRVDGHFFYEEDTGYFRYWHTGDAEWKTIDVSGAGGTTDHGGLTGLGDDDHAIYLLANGTRALSANWDVGAYKITAKQLAADVAIGTAPLVITSTTKVSNLNADLLDDKSSAAFLQADGTVGLSTDWDAGSHTVRALIFQSDQATGTAPLTVASTTVVTNLNADKLDGLDKTGFAYVDHDANHITAGSDEIDGDKLDIDWTPTNYTPATTPAEASNADNLTAHLYGIDQEIGKRNYGTIAFVIGNRSDVLTVGVAGDLQIDCACTIKAATLLADQSGSCVVDIWKDTYANYPPTNADTITSATPPTISTATKSTDTTLTSWTTAITAGDTLRFNVDSVTTITQVTVSLKVEI